MPARAEAFTGDKKQLGDAEQVLKDCAELEGELNELKAQYDQYFLGMERLPPTKHHERLKKRILELKQTFVRQTAAKFRVQQLAQKLATYERLWERSIKEMEAGTYTRDLFKARRHRKEREEREKRRKKGDGTDEDFHIDEDLDLSDLDEGDNLEDALAAASAAVAKPAPAVAPVAPAVKPVSGSVPAVKPVTGTVPAVKPVVASPDGRPTSSSGIPKISAPLGTGATPAVKPAVTGSQPALRPPVTGSNPALKAAASARPAPVAADGGLSDQKIKAIYDAYVMAKKRCGEDTRSVTLDSVSAQLKKQVPELMKQHQARSVEFKVVIKDGKAVLRALPKE